MIKTISNSIIFGIVWIISALPFWFLYRISDLMYLIAFYLIRYRKKVVFKNLKNSFPDKDEDEIKIIAKKFYKHFCDNLIETIALFHMSAKTMKKRMVYKNPELLNDLYRKNKSICLVFGHYCSWDWYSGLPLFTDYKVQAIYLPLKNKFTDRIVKRLREKFGVILISKQTSVHTILNNAKNKLRTVTYFLSDQTPNRDELNYWTDFLNQDTPVFLGTEKIARRTNQAVVYLDVRKLKRGYYEAEFKLLSEDAAKTKEYEITEMHVKMLEKTILRQPEYWLWSHKRWKHKRNKTE